MAYEKQTWKTGDIITEGKLNHMEDGIASASIPLYTPEIIGQHGGANYYGFFASLDGGNGDVVLIVLIKQEDPNDLFKIPQIGHIDGENIDTTRGVAMPMPIPGTWFLNMESSEATEIVSVEDKLNAGFYLNETISSANLYSFGEAGYILFMDHIPNVEYFEPENPLG